MQAVTHIDLEKLVKKLEACVGTSFVDKYWFDSRPHEKDKMNRLGWIYPDFTNKRHTGLISILTLCLKYSLTCAVHVRFSLVIVALCMLLTLLVCRQNAQNASFLLNGVQQSKLGLMLGLLLHY